VNLRGFDPTGSVMNPAEAVRGFLDAFGVPPQRIPASLDAQAGLYRSLLDGKRVLAVLDNARDADQVRPLLPGAPGCLALVTSRNQLFGLIASDGAHPIALDLLSAAEARLLLDRRLGPGRVAAEPDAVGEIITSCARLPLALAIVSARAATHPQFPLTMLADQLRDARGGLDAFTGDDATTDARAVFSWSYQRLRSDAATLFRLFGLHPGPDLATAAAASLAGIPVAQVRPGLAELIRAHLVTERTPGRYTFHDLLRAYATEQVHTHDTDTQRRAAIHRLLDHYLHTAHTAARLLSPTRDPIILAAPQPGVTPEHIADHQQAMAWFAVEHPVLMAAINQATNAGFDTHAWQLAWTLMTFLDRRGHWHDQAATQHAALDAARRLADPSAQANAHRELGRAYTSLGRDDDALTQLRHALDIYGQTGDRVGQARTHMNIHMVLERQGRHATALHAEALYVEALHHVHRALGLFRAAGHRDGQATALNAIGWLHALLGDRQQALTYCQQALIILQELGNRFIEAATWDSLGYAHHLGHHDQAVSCYQHALDLYRELGDRYSESETLIHVGTTHHATGNLSAARDAWQHALSILDDLDHPDADQVRVKLKQVALDEQESGTLPPRGTNPTAGSSSNPSG
jgi:tetratricopeptide (TPR) repeat protein